MTKNIHEAVLSTVFHLTEEPNSSAIHSLHKISKRHMDCFQEVDSYMILSILFSSYQLTYLIQQPVLIEPLTLSPFLVH